MLCVAHDEHFARQLELYPWRHRVKPGITGWAQIPGLRGETKTPEDMQRSAWSTTSTNIENWSIWLDVEILIRTVIALGRGSEAY